MTAREKLRALVEEASALQAADPPPERASERWDELHANLVLAALYEIPLLLEALETAERRLVHSEFHRTSNRRKARRLGKYQGVLEAKIVRQREALNQLQRPKGGST